MPGEPDPSPADTAPAASAPALEVTAPVAEAPKVSPLKERLRKALPEAHRKVLATRDQDKAKGSTPADPGEGAAPEVPSTPTVPVAAPAADPSPANLDEGERVTFGDAPPAEPAAKEGAPAEDHGLTPEQLKALGDDVRKKLNLSSQENAKVRKRAQAAEAQVKELEAKAAAAEQARESALAQVQELQSRRGLDSNTFGTWTDKQAVSTWSDAGKAILAQFSRVSIKHAANEEIPEDLLQYKLPNGQEVKLDSATYEAATQWVEDAKDWEDYTAKASKYREQARPVVEKHAQLTGYEAARKAYLDDPHVSARIDELAAKAAFYDVLEARKGTVLFGKADAASNASTSKAAEVQARAPVPTPTPPREAAATPPRVAPADQAGNAERSQVKARAMKTGDPDAIRAALLAAKFGGQR